ncbi:MAG: hypothetical protein RIE73_22760 [Coleofasciculus sp. C1-SOL-03]|jgi:hypothetical protein|uniref:hypothetical protein n=1 Tax=Coleofasciculus sp. C1-SOL-03 TaxID=3069522 RepID=UPI0032F6ABEF
MFNIKFTCNLTATALILALLSFSLTAVQESSARSVKQQRFAQIESGIKLVGVVRAKQWRYQK